MKFDIIVGNPPYQLNDGGAQSSAKPIYQLFVEQAKSLNPKYLCMIIPARWFSGGKGLDEFRDEMLHDRSIRHLTDYFDSTKCFPKQDISGGVCYFLWDRDHKGDCVIESCLPKNTTKLERPLLEADGDSFIRFNQAVGIVAKINAKHEPKIWERISVRKPFGITTDVHLKNKQGPGDIFTFAYPTNGYYPREKITVNADLLDKYKVSIAYAYGERGDFPYEVIGKPFIAEPGTCLTETYIIIDTFDNKQSCENLISYMQTKFFRFLVLLKKNTQHATRSVYSLVPEQDLKVSWNDKMLYEKYGLSQKEIDFIESMVKPL